MRITQMMAAAVGIALSASLFGCDTSQNSQLPRTLCKTPISAELLAPLLEGGGVVREWTSASFRKPASAAWCVIYVDRREALQLWFSAGGGKPDLMVLAQSQRTVGLLDPRPIQGIGDQAVIGPNGAIASTRCKDSAGADNFTLALRLADNPMKPHRERDVERFMRAYMPATVKSLNCREG